MKTKALAFAVILLCAGCATGSRSHAQRELQRDIATPYAGALKTESTNQLAASVQVAPAGKPAPSEIGSAQAEAAKPVPPDILYDVYIAVAAILLVYLFVLIRRRVRFRAYERPHPA